MLTFQVCLYFRHAPIRAQKNIGRLGRVQILFKIKRIKLLHISAFIAFDQLDHLIRRMGIQVNPIPVSPFDQRFFIKAAIIVSLRMFNIE